MSNNATSFSYPALTTETDAIRVLTLEPGTFYDPLICKLTPAAFSTKPKYVALSYTWGDPDPDTARLPTSSDGPKDSLTDPSKTLTDPSKTLTISLNGHSFEIGHNLYLALLYLRSSTHSLTLWVDAICINQVNVVERNSQVAMMSFIYTRAQKVAAWLAVNRIVPHPPMEQQVFKLMESDWRAGQIREFAASLATGIKLEYSNRPSDDTFEALVECSYWRRLWIVQEMCVPRQLVFIYGPEIWTYEEVRECARRKSRTDNAVRKLIDTRDARHTGAMSLETLIEAFRGNACTDLRDRVYGLLGVVNDIRPFSKGDDDRLEKYISSLDFDEEGLPEPPRGPGTIKADYNRSFYDIWTDVVKFVYFWARTDEERIVRHIDADIRLNADRCA